MVVLPDDRCGISSGACARLIAKAGPSLNIISKRNSSLASFMGARAPSNKFRSRAVAPCARTSALRPVRFHRSCLRFTNCCHSCTQRTSRVRIIGDDNVQVLRIRVPLAAAAPGGLSMGARLLRAVAADCCSRHRRLAVGRCPRPSRCNSVLCNPRLAPPLPFLRGGLRV